MEIKNKGFSLIEMIISIGIISLLVSVVVLNYRRSTDKLALNAAAQEIAIAVRQAQVYGLSVREDTPSSNSFTYSYGVHFNASSLPTSYRLYINRTNPSSNTYDAGTGNCGAGTTECKELFTLRNGVTIEGVCNSSVNPEVCHSGNFSADSTLDILFARPNPTAITRLQDSIGGVSYPAKVKIKLISSLNQRVSVIVENTGNILIQ